MMMSLKKIYQDQFKWTDEQWTAFINLTQNMGFTLSEQSIFEQTFKSTEEALSALNPIMQKRIYRSGPENPFGPAGERFDIKGSTQTEWHTQIADALITLGLHRTSLPEASTSPFSVDAAFILGSTVPSMDKRLQFFKESVLPSLEKQERPAFIMGLSGTRPLIPAKRDPERGLLGDISDESSPGGGRFMSTAEVSSFPPQYTLNGQGTEAGAMAVLAQEILPDWAYTSFSTVNATGKMDLNPADGSVKKDAAGAPLLKRPDTEDTAYYAGLALHKKMVPIHRDFKLAIITDALFPGQKEQVLSGLLRAGIRLLPEQVIFYGKGYSDALLRSSVAYLQIAASALAEQAYSLGQRFTAERKYSEDCSLHGGIHSKAAVFDQASEGYGARTLFAARALAGPAPSCTKGPLTPSA